MCRATVQYGGKVLSGLALWIMGCGQDLENTRQIIITEPRKLETVAGVTSACWGILREVEMSYNRNNDTEMYDFDDPI